ncbi:MAG: hypothetical protein ACTHKQ_25840 [Mesorhizobium sp.]
MMDFQHFASIAGATALAGCYHSYRMWKKERAALPDHQRNAMFWNDRRLKIADMTFHISLALFALASIGLSVWLIGGSWGWWCWPYCQLQ